ncbi:gluconeogenesis factor YvcK family protein [Desulfosediminicola ganghwensis]|uniref:gluconeogenesis factor YvcK family protein n=1 Tax=Desulfosediminicola ganghwensis TaxID=2569540 RepID=UPI0010AB6EDE|nr:2-phospho-L-lactate transferase CofD family protein [Desulfosediminicola ganghwensis]
MTVRKDDKVADSLEKILAKKVSPLDLLSHKNLREKFIDLVLNGEPIHQDPEITRLYSGLVEALNSHRIDGAKVVVFGGGTGLSNIIGGDSRLEGWARSPFNGLKEIFPRTRSVVCVTDDGGSTGEIMKDLPLIAIGDIRHVLLSSIQLSALQRTYQVSVPNALLIIEELTKLFNYRFSTKPDSAEQLFSWTGADLERMPGRLSEVLLDLISQVFTDDQLEPVLNRPNCLGNLIVVSAIYRHLPDGVDKELLISDPGLFHEPIYKGLEYLALSLGVGIKAVLPCTTTPCQLRLVYTNGVQTTGESKAGGSRRGVPVESAHVDFCTEPRVYQEIIDYIDDADIIVMAPGSLYSSIIPVFKVPGLADAVRRNGKALKILVSNLWVQAGETDLSMSDPERKFRVSDMIKAYERNIPGGIQGLFHEVLCLSLKDVPASVIQSYAVEGKIPIYLDREVVRNQGFVPVECGIYSRQALVERGVLQHDPAMLATAVRVLYAGKECFAESKHSDFSEKGSGVENPVGDTFLQAGRAVDYPCRNFQIPSVRYQKVIERIHQLEIGCNAGCTSDCCRGVSYIRDVFEDLIWRHHDIPLDHLQYINGVACIGLELWPRNQQWDNIFAFYDPVDRMIKIRKDQLCHKAKLETGILIAIGESLLGDYALKKQVEEVALNERIVGKVYNLELRDEQERNCYLNTRELDDYLHLARMFRGGSYLEYTRLLNGNEGFTPPGLLMGLSYVWYLENRLSPQIEYKMTVMKIPQTDLIPEQKKVARRRYKLIKFFRDVVFKQVGDL